MLQSFPAEFHEPFYEDYLADDLAGILAECRVRSTCDTEPQLVAKVVSSPRARLN